MAQMLLQNPRIFSPANEDIDPALSNTFSCQIQGNKCVGYNMSIYNNSDTTYPVYNTGDITLGAPWYNGDTLDITVAGGTISANTVDANSSTDIITLVGHGLVNNQPIVLNSGTGVIPPPLVANRIYYVIYIDSSTFKLSLTSGGAEINITANGTTGWIFSTNGMFPGQNYAWQVRLYWDMNSINTSGTVPYPARNSVTLASGASIGINGYYNGLLIYMYFAGAAPAVGHIRNIIGYDSVTNIVTLDSAIPNDGGTTPVYIYYAVQSGQVYFQARSTPTISLNVDTQNTNSYPAIITYAQAESVPVKHYTINLYDSAQVLLDTSDVNGQPTYSANTIHTFSGLLNGNTYYADCSVENQDGYVVATTPTSFAVTYSADTYTGVVMATVLPTVDAVRVDWVINEDVSGVDHFDLYRLKSGDSRAQFVCRVDSDIFSVLDFMCGNNTEYKYLVYPITSTLISSSIESEVFTMSFWNWCIISYQNPNLPFTVFQFDIDLTSGTKSNEVDFFSFKTFLPYDKISYGKRNFLKWNLNCLIGYIDPITNEYVDTVDYYKQLQEVINDGYDKIIKDRKGNIYVCATSQINPTTNDILAEQIQRVEINCQEVDSPNNVQVSLITDLRWILSPEDYSSYCKYVWLDNGEWLISATWKENL